MLNKIKDLMQVKELIDEIKEETNSYSKDIKTLKDSIEGLKSQLAEQGKIQKEYMDALKKDVGAITKIKEDFKEELYDFKLLKSETEKKLISKFDEEIKKHLVPHFERLKTDAENYNKLKDNVLIISKKIDGTSSEIDKFMAISEKIKAGDYDLTKYAKQLKTTEDEKLELLRKIDNLERLLAKMRRGNR